MGDLREREFSVLVLPLTLLMLLLATPHITFIQAELSKPRNMQQKFDQCQYQSYWKQLNEPKKLQCSRRELLATELNMDDEDTKTNTTHTTAKGTTSVWITASEDPNSDTIIKRMRDQIIMAEVYSKLEGSQNEPDLYNSLIRQSKACSEAIREADLDIELNQPRALRQAKKMDHILSIAETKLHDCAAISKKLRAMIHAREDNANAQDKKAQFLSRLTSKTLPKPLHCLPQLLTVDSFLEGNRFHRYKEEDKFEDPSFYHYAIFSDNVLATSVVVNSGVSKAEEPEKHVFHIVTDRLNFRAMRMWFHLNAPAAVVQVQSYEDDFEWLNLTEYHRGLNEYNKNKYRNPRYTSMLNHLRFYLPDLFPELDKILFLDDDIVVQKDLAPLWSIDLEGMVNAAVEAPCKQGFHTLADYLNFQNPIISSANFDPNSCAWAFGMNMFDLEEWRVHSITEIYHYWQHINVKHKVWRLGSFPPGLVAFYNRTYLLHSKWHMTGLGYDPEISLTEIENAAVIHYTGNCKPWLDCSIAKYKSYWLRYVMFDRHHIQTCKIGEYLGYKSAV